MLEPVPNLGVIYGKYLIVADLHFGALRVPDEEVFLAEAKDIVARLTKSPAKSLIINGDVKEDIGKPPKAVHRALIELLRELDTAFSEIIIVKGNHDGLLESIIRESRVPATVIRSVYIGKIAIFHGHRKARQDELGDSELIITGHIHPSYDVTGFGRGIKAWLLAELAFEDEGRRIRWLVLPAFSDATFGFMLNNLTLDDVVQLAPLKSKEIRAVKVAILSGDLTPLEELEPWRKKEELGFLNC